MEINTNPKDQSYGLLPTLPDQGKLTRAARARTQELRAKQVREAEAQKAASLEPAATKPAPSAETPIRMHRTFVNELGEIVGPNYWDDKPYPSSLE